MRSLPFFLLFFSLALPSARANEALLQSMQSQMASVEKLVQSMQSSIVDLRRTVESQNEVIKNQDLRIQGLEQGREGTPAQQAAVSRTGRLPKMAGLSQGFNPDIGVVGTVQANLTENSEDAEGMDTIALKEIELNVSQYVDPYSRLDAVIAFNDNLEEQNVDIEEAYYTHWGLPLGFTGQIGKFRSKIGKQNLLHLDQLPTTNYPLVIRDFFGEEGLSSSGVRLQNYIPNPWDIPVEITGEVLRGNNGNSFSGISRRPIFNVHGKTFFELTDEANLELGWTTMFGDENPPQFLGRDDGMGAMLIETAPEGRAKYGVTLYGADATLTLNLDEGRTLKWQNEVYFQNRGELVHVNQDPWGFYSLLDFRFSPKFSAGVRFDYLEPLDIIGEHSPATEISPYFTFWQSEFANFRIQYSHVEPAGLDQKSDDAVYLQANFLIGAHQHPVQ